MITSLLKKSIYRFCRYAKRLLMMTDSQLCKIHNYILIMLHPKNRPISKFRLLRQRRRYWRLIVTWELSSYMYIFYGHKSLMAHALVCIINISVFLFTTNVFDKNTFASEVKTLRYAKGKCQCPVYLSRPIKKSQIQFVGVRDDYRGGSAIETTKTEALCQTRRGTIKITSSSRS